MQPHNGIPVYDQTASALAFPLGGIGTGNVSLGARGDLRDWEIFNRPAKGNTLPNTFFVLRTQIDDQEPMARVLEGPVQPPYTPSHGFHPSTTVGLPRMSNAKFLGEYPIATIEFEEPDLPVHVQLEAFTPLIPLNPDDSGIPCAIFTYTLTNVSKQAVKITIAGSLSNPVGRTEVDNFGNRRLVSGKTINQYRDESGFRGLYLSADDIESGGLDFGNMSFVTDHTDVTAKPAWLRSGWWDYLQEFWDDLFEDGLLNDLGYDTPATDHSDSGSIGLVDTLEPGATRSYRFILTWYFPNRPNHWDYDSKNITRNHYANQFDSAWGVANYVVKNFERLQTETRRFRDALFGTTLPSYVLDAISANIVPVRSNTCFWLEDGRFFGWEGCFDNAGCCTGTCTHVWAYVYTVAYLFPSLEREMRRIEFAVETEEDGYMAFRNFKTFDPNYVWSWGGGKIAALDGQMGCILRAYREWQLSGDKEWLASIWPAIKHALDYVSIHWDSDGDGIPDIKQHNTYDIEFYGPNPLCAIYYFAALRAVEELSLVMGEPELAPRLRSAFERASQRFDQLAWNGEYYIQVFDDINAYKYQHGQGCLSDQMLGQLHARVLGLGDLLPVDHVRSTIKAIFDHNFRRDFTRHVNLQRTYALNGEDGLLMCTWPQGGRPHFPFPYSDEVWTGVEYHVAAHLIYEGWLQEGLAVVEAIRARHNGIGRSPWNEVECGHHYARSMSSWTVLTALTGAACDLGRGELRFEPVLEASTNDTAFTTFWSTGRGWGTYTQHKNAAGAWEPSVEVLGGDLKGVRVIACGREIQY